jgi:hypothetical protein
MRIQEKLIKRYAIEELLGHKGANEGHDDLENARRVEHHRLLEAEGELLLLSHHYKLSKTVINIK